jgi:uncharacterized protein (DUF1800 family)
MATRVSLSTISSADWTPRHARHLLNRAGFGIPETEVERLAAMTPQDAVASLVRYTDTPDTLTEPNFLVTAEDYAAHRAVYKAASEEERRKLNNEMNVRERAAVLRLQAWWFERFCNSPRPLQEKMTLFWHGHFATSAQKVKTSRANYHHNRVLRDHATGNFKALTTAVGQSPAMMRYLDNVQNVKGSPNENWARELMELFTLGVGHYTEQDIKESARAFTGWSTSGDGEFRFQEARHDFGPKTFMGKTGDFDGWDIINIIFEQPAAAEYIVTKLWTHFAYEKPSADIVQPLADVFRRNDYEITPLLEAMFTSKAFFSEMAMGTQIKSPAQFLVQLAHDLALASPPYVAMARASAALGQNLFYPPNVAGWDGGRQWINANTLLARYNMSRSIVVADFFEPDEMSMMDMGAMRGDGRSYQKQFKAALETAPPEMRKEVRTKMAEAPNAEARRAILEDTMIDLEAGRAWNVQAIFGALDFANAGACADALAARYLNTALAADQREILIAALAPNGDAAAPVSAAKLSAEQMTSALHLLFSLAEYQLC